MEIAVVEPVRNFRNSTAQGPRAGAMQYKQTASTAKIGRGAGQPKKAE